jgi:hypothetical protein
VRVHFFDKFMNKTDWKKAADGMRFIEDYVDFMGMLQQLAIDKDENKLAHRRQMTSFVLGPAVINTHQLPGYSDGKTLPERFEVHNRACHRFNVLSWFFDCRDAGACRYMWEDWVLETSG